MYNNFNIIIGQSTPVRWGFYHFYFHDGSVVLTLQDEVCFLYMWYLSTSILGGLAAEPNQASNRRRGFCAHLLYAGQQVTIQS
eukprot:m.50120 g.50120  ORF g.50120 m.50120 type:complete len:83 (-) comp10647_c0_seq3:902-1150(-)